MKVSLRSLDGGTVQVDLDLGKHVTADGILDAAPSLAFLLRSVDLQLHAAISGAIRSGMRRRVVVEVLP